MNKEIYINYRDTISNALNRIEATKQKALICVDSEEKLKGMLLDGDIRRGLLAGYEVKDPVENVMNKEPIYLNENATWDEIQGILSSKIKVIPIVDYDGGVVDYHIFNEKHESYHIRSKNITILGMGYVGLTLGLVMADIGFKVTGLDIDQNLVCKLSKCKEPFYEEGLKKYLDRLVGSRINFVSDAKSACADVYIITVGTPLLKTEKRPNTEYIQKAAESIGKLLKRGDLVILRSTVPAGSSKQAIIPTLEKLSGLKCGEDFFLSFAPERTAEGVALRELRKNPQIIGAYDPISYEMTSRIFETLTHTVINVGSLEAAEMSKLIDNTYRDHLFAYVNNLAKLTEKMDLNLNVLIDAVNFGYARNQVPKPSPGVGGPCLSKDPYILNEVFQMHGLSGELLLASRMVNEEGPMLLKSKLESLLNKAGKKLNSSKVSLIGMAFKGYPETSDLRDSTSLWFLELLKGCSKICAYDPIVPMEAIADLGVVPVDREGAFDDADAVVILNNHRSYRNWNLDSLFDRMQKPAVFIDTWSNFEPIYLKQQNGIFYGGLGNV